MSLQLSSRLFAPTYHEIGGRRDRYAALEDRLLAVNDRHVGQRQLEDGRHQRRRRDVVLVGTMELRTEPTHDLDVFVGDLLGCGLFHDDVLARDVSLNVRPSDECLRRLSGRRDGELDLGQRTGRCRFYLLNAVHGNEPYSAPIVTMRYGKGPYSHQLLPSCMLW